MQRIKNQASFAGILFLILIITVASLAEVPQQISYQGYLTDPSGTPVHGEVEMTFAVWDRAAGGEEPLWSEVQTIFVSNGIYSVQIGQDPLGNSFPSNLVEGERYLEVSVDGTVLSPRSRLTSTPFSLKAGDADTLDGMDSSRFLPSQGAGTLSASSTDPLLSVSNKGDGNGVYAVTRGDSGDAVFGYATGISGWGLRGEADGSFGRGVHGYASATGDIKNYGGYFESNGDNGMAVYGKGSAAGGVTNFGGYFEVNGDNGKAVFGHALATGDVTNYGGYFLADGAGGTAVAGYATETGAVENYGGNFRADGRRGSGVNGEAYGANGIGVSGNAKHGGEGQNYGGRFTAQGKNGFGVYGETRGETGTGVLGWALGDHGWGVRGYASSSAEGENYGGLFEASGSKGYGVYAVARGAEGEGVYGEAKGAQGKGVSGKAPAIGGYFQATKDFGGQAVYAFASGNQGTGIFASGKKFAGEFEGHVDIQGFVAKRGSNFKIDHPLDPENKYLYHSVVESPDMKNLYDGIVVLDENGEGWVDLPEWFEALNMDFRYQLTCIGGFAPVYIAQEISDNSFKIAGGTVGVKVSWQVTGVRKDPWAEANRMQVEREKPENERGHYLHPELYGKPPEFGIKQIHHPAVTDLK